MTKRRDVIRKIAAEAAAQGLTWGLARKGGNHEIWKLDGLMIPIGNHRELPELLAETIYKECADKLGEDWWK